MATDIGTGSTSGAYGETTTPSVASAGVEEAKHLAEVGTEKAKEAVSAAKSQVMERADAEIGSISERLSGVAEKLTGTFEGDSFESQTVQKIASYIRQGADGLQGKSARELGQMASDELRRRPGLITIGLVAIGFMGGRLLRA